MRRFIRKVRDSIYGFYSSNFYNFEKNIKYHYKFYSDEELVDQIIYHNKSIARFGDGEFMLIWNKPIGFQINDSNLSKDLNNCLTSENDNLIICVPHAMVDISQYSEKTKKFYKHYYFRYRKRLDILIPKEKVYGDSLITRFYMDYEDKEKCEARVTNLKRIWKNRKILIIEGYNSKLGVGNDLFNSASRIRRILVPNTDAYSKKNEIIKAVKEYYEKDEIVILAVGPTATVLACELSKAKIQAVDLGHIDLEYEWFKMGAKEIVDIKGKNVNELHHNVKSGTIDEYDTEYEKSILVKI